MKLFVEFRFVNNVPLGDALGRLPLYCIAFLDGNIGTIHDYQISAYICLQLTAMGSIEFMDSNFVL